MSFLLISFCVACSGDTASLVAEIDAKLPAVVAAGNSPSIQVAVVQGDRVVWSGAFGENTGVDHVYMCASVQKVFTAIAVIQLVERGLVDLDADINSYLPFAVRHPGFPETPITVRMLLAHRSGMGGIPNQFDWDTQSVFSPRFRPPCPADLLAMSHEEFLEASLTPGSPQFFPQTWTFPPGRSYGYSVSAYPLMRYMVGRVAGQSFAGYMRENVFDPLGMTGSGFSAEEFAGRHAIPHSRIDGENIELPMWSGNGTMMHTTAADMARAMLALMNGGRYGDFQLLQPESIELMGRRTSRFKTLFKSSDDMFTSGHGLGMFSFRGGWLGHGGSAPGFQTLFRFQPSRRVGFVIMSNVNAILGGGDNYKSARNDIYEVQNMLASILDPLLVIRGRMGELSVAGGLGLYFIVVGWWIRRRRRRTRTG